MTMTLRCVADGESTCTVSCKAYREGGGECPPTDQPSVSVPLWCAEHMEPYCPRHHDQPSTPAPSGDPLTDEQALRRYLRDARGDWRTAEQMLDRLLAARAAQPPTPTTVEALADEVIDAIEETFLASLPSKALSYCAQEDVNAGLDAMRERFDTPEHQTGARP